MNKKTSNPAGPDKPVALRKAAEAQLTQAPKTEVAPRPAEELLHELQVYQIELEMQNEQLRQAQVALEESRDRYVDFYDFAPVGYLTLTDKGVISEMNITGSMLLKAERNKLLHRRFATLVAPEHRDRWELMLATILKKKSGESCDLALKNDAGKSLHVYLDCMYRVTGGRPVVRITFSDITHLRQAEEAMREWQKFVEYATWGMTIGDIESRVIRQANPAYARMHGYALEELRNINADAMYAPEGRANLPEYIERVRKDGRYSFECERLRKDGSTFPAVVDISKVDGVDGKTTVMVCVKDITERKLAEFQLMERERQYYTLADSGQALIWVSGTDKLCNYFNQPWLKFTGRTLEQELGNGWAEGVHPDDLQRCIEVYVSSFDRREKFSMDYRLRHRDGSYRWVQDDGCPRYNSKGEFAGYIGYCLDITVRKQAEQQLRDLAAHLQLVREDEKASIAREIHDDMGGTLTSLKMQTYWLKTELAKDKNATRLLDHVWEISKLTDHASGVMRNIITGLRPTILDDLGLLAALEWQAAQFQKHTGIKCRVNFACAGNDAYAKELDKPCSIALFRISQEALSNVVRHSGASEVEIEYHHGDDEVVMSIIDNGRGMAEKRTDAAIPFGVLGMSERVDQLGGKISFNSPPGGGFDVTVILPQSAKEEGKEA